MSIIRGVRNINGVSGAITLKSSDSSIIIAPSPSTNEIDIRSAVGGGSGVAVTKVDFSFADAPSLALKSFLTGDTLARVVIDVKTPFTPGSQILVGFPGDLDAIAAITDIDEAAMDINHELKPYLVFSGPDTLMLTITGGPVAGTGTIFIAEGV